MPYFLSTYIEILIGDTPHQMSVGLFLGERDPNKASGPLNHSPTSTTVCLSGLKEKLTIL